jgi:TPR repeat protein
MEQAAGKVRLELDQQRDRQAAAEQARLEQQERERLATAAYLEQEKREQLAQERGGSISAEHPGSFSRSPAWMKITFGASGVLGAVLVLYLATRPNVQKGEVQQHEIKTKKDNPPPPDNGSSDKTTADKAAAGKAVTDNSSADKGAAAKGYPDTAAAMKQPATEPLSAEAMYKKGLDYRRSEAHKPGAKDYKPAVSWFRKSAEAGNTHAMVQLGYIYQEGQGVQQDLPQAMSWFRKAAQAGDPQGMVDLGEMYHGGTGVDQDFQQAVSWYRKAAEAGNAQGMWDLGTMYEYGYGVEKDRGQAIAWYRKAAQQGDHFAKEHLKSLGVSAQ